MDTKIDVCLTVVWIDTQVFTHSWGKNMQGGVAASATTHKKNQ